MNLGNFRFKLCFIKSYSSMLYRSLSSIKPQHNVSIEHLKQRCLLRLSGPDTANYLQGMVTNDMISNNNVDQPCMYALLLNFHGRILYDTLLYKVAENEYLMEYDASAVQYMKRHLEMYRLRKHVIVRPVTEMSVWVAYPHENTDSNFNSSSTNEFISSLKSTDFVVAAVKDPRIPDLGFRIITQNNNKVEQLLENFVTKSPENTPYNLFRYKLGVGEGVLDHPPGNSFPFETNVDFLNGVSFQKGCYIGQELTARVHHTGVVRKRIMPIVLQLESESYPNLPVSCTVVNDKGAKVGKFRSNIGKYGLAVLNTEECLKAQTLMLNRLNIKLTTFRPNWWPQDIYSIKH